MSEHATSTSYYVESLNNIHITIHMYSNISNNLSMNYIQNYSLNSESIDSVINLISKSDETYSIFIMMDLFLNLIANLMLMYLIPNCFIQCCILLLLISEITREICLIHQISLHESTLVL